MVVVTQKSGVNIFGVDVSERTLYVCQHASVGEPILESGQGVGILVGVGVDYGEGLFLKGGFGFCGWEGKEESLGQFDHLGSNISE